MINKKLEEVTENDLQELINNKVLEGKSIEYKLGLTLTKDADKKEFLADVSSFANSVGGDLIFGIRSNKTGEPDNISGIAIVNPDAEILKIEAILRTGITPKINGLLFKMVSLKNSLAILIIRIPRSWNSPHMVAYQMSSKFFTRATNGKYQMDVNEIRDSFSLNEGISNKINNFRLDRISRIFSNDTYLNFPQDAALIVLHILPFSSFSRQEHASLKFIKEFWKELKPIHVGSWNHRYNIDGYMGFSFNQSYVEVFRNGMIEATDSNLLAGSGSSKTIPSKTLEDQLIYSLSNYLKVLQRHEIEGPASIALSLINIQGYYFAGNRYANDVAMGTRLTLKHPVINLPENVIMDFNADCATALKPIFDALWNAYGFQGSENYDKDGVRTP